MLGRLNERIPALRLRVFLREILHSKPLVMLAVEARTHTFITLVVVNFVYLIVD